MRPPRRTRSGGTSEAGRLRFRGRGAKAADALLEMRQPRDRGAHSAERPRRGHAARLIRARRAGFVSPRDLDYHRRPEVNSHLSGNDESFKIHSEVKEREYLLRGG